MDLDLNNAIGNQNADYQEADNAIVDCPAYGINEMMPPWDYLEAEVNRQPVKVEHFTQKLKLNEVLAEEMTQEEVGKEAEVG